MAINNITVDVYIVRVGSPSRPFLVARRVPVILSIVVGQPRSVRFGGQKLETIHIHDFEDEIAQRCLWLVVRVLVAPSFGVRVVRTKAQH